MRTRFISAAAVIAICIAALAAPALGGAAAVKGGALIGVQADPATAGAFCADVKESGADAMVLSVSRPNVDKGAGIYNFTGVDGGTGTERNCGVTSALRVFGQRNTDTRRFPADPSGYAAFLTALSSHEAAQNLGVHRYAIENEVDVVNHWDDTPQHYFDLLRIAYAAVHVGDPNAIVVDSTFSVAGLYTVRINELYDAGQKADALALYRVMITNVLGGESPNAKAIDTEAELGTYLESAQPQRILEFYRLLLQSQDSFDAFQVHFYGPADRYPELIDMLRRSGMTKPIETWELGHRYRDGRPFDDADWAGDVSRLIDTAVGEGSRFTILQLLNDRLEDNLEYGLLTDAGARRQAFYSFRTTARLLEGATASNAVGAPSPTVAYRYDRPVGPVYAFWAPSGLPLVGGSLGIGQTTGALTNGQAARPKQARLKFVHATPSPRFIEPDLLAVRRLPFKVKRKIRVALACPANSLPAKCFGSIKVSGKKGKKRTRLADVTFKLARGKTQKRTITLRGPGMPFLITAEAKTCPAGVKPCRTTLRLGSN